MKTTFTLLFALAVCLAITVPAMADNLYDNGPINGNVEFWTINFGYAVSDSFTLTGQSTIDQIEFGGVQFPGDTLTSVEVQIGTSPFGNTLFDGVVSMTQSNCFDNAFGFVVCTQTGNFNGPTLGSGTYWLTLSNASVPSGDPFYWDENSGVGCQSPGCPSQAQENTLGTIPSESFTLGGTASTTGGTTPEPSSVVLFGSASLGLAGLLRRKLL